jgi:hypothetical protein
MPEGVAALEALVHHPEVPLGAELALRPRQHALHRPPVGVALGDRTLGVELVEVLQDDQALLDDPPAGDLQDRQRRRAARLLQQPFGPRAGDVDDAELDFRPPTFQRQQDLQSLAEGADGDVVDDRSGHGGGAR